MDLFIRSPHAPGATAGFKPRIERAPVARALGLTLAAVLLAALLVPLASPLAAPVAAADESTADETTDETTTQDDDGHGAATTETPVVEETPVAEETPATDESLDAGLTGGNTSRIVVFIRECATDYGADFFQFDANCGTTEIPFELSGFDGNGTYVYQTGTTFLDIYVAGGSYTIHQDIPQGYREPTVFCTKGTTAVPYTEFVTYEGYLEFTLAANEHIGCHFFNIPKNAAVSYGALQLEFLDCPPVEAIPFPFDYATANVGQLATICSLYRDGSVPFNLKKYGTGFDLTMHTDPANNAIASWASVPTGTVFLTTEPWAGYGSPRVFCYYDNAPANIFETTVQGWDASFTISRGVWAVCSWFNIPAEAPTSHVNGTVAVLKHFCDGIFDDGIDPYGATRDELLAACPAYTGDQVAFELDHQGTGETSTRSTGATGDGAALWEGIPGGDLTITEIAGTDGYGKPVVFCYTYDPKALVIDSAFAPVQVHNRGIDYELYDDFSLYCDWFNIPADGGDGNGADGEATVVVTVVNYACPESATALKAFADYAQTCTEAAEGVSFKLDGASTGNPGDFPTDADGRVAWDEREADHYYLSAEVPAGYGQPVAFCDTYRAHDEGSPAYEAHTPSYYPDGDPFTYRVEFDLAAGESIVCLWFNIPAGEAAGQYGGNDGGEDGGEDGRDVAAGESGEVVVYSWVCPASDAQSSDLPGLYANCEPAAEAVAFHLIDAEGNDDVRQTDGRSRVRWDGVAAGQYGLRQETPDGYGRSIVYCDLVEGEANWMPEPWAFAGEAIEFAHEGDGWVLVCDWFNVPAAGAGDAAGKVATDKHRCGAVYVLAPDCAPSGGVPTVAPRLAGGQATGEVTPVRFLLAAGVAVGPSGQAARLSA